MFHHRGPGIGSTLSKVFTMRNITRHRLEIHLPLFAWADTRDRSPSKLLRGYRLDSRLTVIPIWREVHHER